MTGRLVQRADLDDGARDAMHALLIAHFAGVTRAQFDADLSEKNWVILLERDGALVGFSTLLVYETTFRNGPVSVVYSGDTIVAPEAWGSAALPQTWIGAVNRLRDRYPNGPYYWLLITSGFRTYRFLPLFWQSFTPRFDVRTPADDAALLDQLARERFGDAYDAEAGVVRFPRPQRLRDGLSGIPPERLADPHVAFFAARNPGHDDGDELVCLCELSEENLTAAGRRMVFGPARREACSHLP